MAKCPFCYQHVATGDYHEACSKRFFGSAKIPLLDLDKEKLDRLAQLTVGERLALTGVQPKLSLSLAGKKDEKRLTLVGLWGDYILKPQSTELALMPETEDLTMHLAYLFAIKTAEHSLIRTTQGELAYITKRYDRNKGKKIHVEDLCQLSELLTEQKYKSSYERVGKVIRQFAANPGLDAIKYFKLVLFCFLTGNNDMHLKNFSLIHTEKGILLSPAYDLLNVNLIYPKDREELALTLNGRKKNIKRIDFDLFAQSMHINEKARDNIYGQFAKTTNPVRDLIARSFLPTEHQSQYLAIFLDKMKQIKLISS